MQNNLLCPNIEAAKLYLKENGYYVEQLWHMNDIQLICEQRGWPILNLEESKMVFSIFGELYDGEFGMTWPKLEQALQVYLAQAGRITEIKKHGNFSANSIRQLMIEQKLPQE